VIATIYHPLARYLTGIPLFLAQEAAGVSLALVVSYGFHLLFERPFLRRRKQETSAEIARDAALSPAP
jgi:hypothetical protein